MPDPEDKASEEVEVVAHSDEEDEELNAGCLFNGDQHLA